VVVHCILYQNYYIPVKCLWCTVIDAFQNTAIDATNDYKLKHLVEVFGLSGDLIAE